MTAVPDRHSLFDQVLAELGLASMIGPGVVQRALKDEGIASYEEARASDYLGALPRIRSRLAMYMSEAQADARIVQLQTLLRRM